MNGGPAYLVNTHDQVPVNCPEIPYTAWMARDTHPLYRKMCDAMSGHPAWLRRVRASLYPQNRHKPPHIMQRDAILEAYPYMRSMRYLPWERAWEHRC